MSQPRFQWITDNKYLSLVMERLSGCTIYIDTEFSRRKTYWPKPALIQIRASEQNWLIDPLKIDDWTPLSRLLVNTSSAKVFHAGTEDLQLLWKLCDQFPDPYYDTQIAQALLSAHSSIGYNALVRLLLDIRLENSRNLQTSNWLRRPLSSKQCDYAVKDVFYLEQIYHKQLSMLKKIKDREQWCQQECRQQIEQTKADCTGDSRLAYLNVRGIGHRLSMPELKRLQLLAQWREQQARERDIVRGHLLSDSDMLGIVRNTVLTSGDWHRIAKSNRLYCRKSDTQSIKESIAQAKNMADPQRPLSIMSKSLSETYKLMVVEKKRIAMTLGISDQLLANKKSLHLFLLSQGEQGFNGWRGELLHNSMMDIIRAQDDQDLSSEGK